MDNNDPNNPNPASNAGIAPLQPPQNPLDVPPGTASAENPAGGSLNSPAPASDPTFANSPWSSSAGTTQMTGSLPEQTPLQDPGPINPPPPAAPVNQNVSNPYLQPQQEIPPTGITQFGSGQGLTQAGETTPTSTENSFPMSPAQPPQQDPLNTAFTPPPAPDQANPFAPAQTPQADLPQQQSPFQAPSEPLTAGGGVPPQQPQNPLPDPTQNPTAPSAPEVYNQNVENPQIPSTNQTGTLDLSALQNSAPPASEGSSVSPQGTQIPQTVTENAPTDLSHLIAGDETNPQPGDIYNPPLVTDQNPSSALSQPQPTPEEGTPPPGKHLNLTKVLLVAGIPIILIVAALSAYMILGIGKPASESDTPTSLPIEKTNQAPLTNPPQQITAPSPSQAALPQASDSTLDTMNESTSSSSTLPGASSSPMSAIEKAKARQAASPSPASSTTP